MVRGGAEVSHPVHEHEGREVSEIHWANPDNSCSVIKSDEKRQLRFHSDYLGDHSENWILELSCGKELRRHNTRFIETIVWIED